MTAVNDNTLDAKRTRSISWIPSWVHNTFAVLGMLVLANGAVDMTSTSFIRNSDNPLSRIEKGWKACDAKPFNPNSDLFTDEADMRERCKNDVYAAERDEKERLMVSCNMTQSAPFVNYRESLARNVWSIPVYYDAPLLFIFSRCRDDIKKGIYVKDFFGRR